jgi:hypothetical protein
MSRFEFRIWDRDLIHLKHDLERLSGSAKSIASDETYLISMSTDDCTVKIRSGLLDIKVLRKVERRLELWEPILKAEFPVDKATIERTFAELKLQPPQLTKSSYHLDEFLNEAARNGILTVRVRKLRNEVRINGCQAEFAAVKIDEVARDTVAVESEDADAVLTSIERLEISERTNTCYVREIKSVRARS